MHKGRILLAIGDAAEVLDTMYPLFRLQEEGYEVLVAGSPTPSDLKQLLTGVWLSDGRVKAKAVKRFKRQGDSTWLKIVLAEGKNREVRRMLAKLNHKVMRLRRVGIGPVKLDRLPKGKSRRLALTEVEALKKSVERKPAKPQPAHTSP